MINTYIKILLQLIYISFQFKINFFQNFPPIKVKTDNGKIFRQILRVSKPLPPFRNFLWELLITVDFRIIQLMSKMNFRKFCFCYESGAEQASFMQPDIQ